MAPADRQGTQEQDRTMNTESARRHLMKHGFVVMPGVIEPDDLERLRDRVALFYRAWDSYPAATRKEIPPAEQRGGALAVREINWPAAALRLLDDEPAVARVRGVVDALAGRRCRLIHANSLLKPARGGAAIAPHQDTAYNPTGLINPLTAWIPFEAVDATRGGLFYLGGSHMTGERRHDASMGVQWLPENAVPAGPEICRHSYQGGPGSIGIHDSRVVHGSHPNESDRHRLALSLRFEAARSRTR